MRLGMVALWIVVACLSLRIVMLESSRDQHARLSAEEVKVLEGIVANQKKFTEALSALAQNDVNLAEMGNRHTAAMSNVLQVLESRR